MSEYCCSCGQRTAYVRALIAEAEKLLVQMPATDVLGRKSMESHLEKLRDQLHEMTDGRPRP